MTNKETGKRFSDGKHDASNTQQEHIQQAAIQALRKGDFDFALKAMKLGDVNIETLIEDLKIYQAELELQNDELRQNQLRSDNATQRFRSLFENLPLPAIVIDQIGIIHETNEMASRQFNLAQKNLRSHFFPRLVHKEFHGRLNRMLKQAFDTGQATLNNVIMHGQQIGYTVDIHITLLPNFADADPHFVVSIIDQTQSILRLKEMQTILSISRLAQQENNLDAFLIHVIKMLPQGMRFPTDAEISITLMNKTYTSPLYDQIQTSISSSIESENKVIGKILIGYKQEYTPCPLDEDKQTFINTVADQIGRFISHLRIDQERALTAKRSLALLSLTTLAPSMSEDELLKYALTQAESLTGSDFAYAYFVNDDQTSLALTAYSKNSLLSADELSNHALSSSSIGLKCLKQKSSLIHNRTLALPERHICVPVLAADKIKMIMIIANKSSDYDQGDLAVLEMIANNTWALMQRNRSQRQLELHAAVFSSSREGIIITNSTCEITSVNNAFCRITGYSLEDVIGKNPKLLQSGKHDAAFFKMMWVQINSCGYWHGEIWNRRKNGEIYPQLLSSRC